MRVGVLGATSLVGRCLVTMLRQRGFQLTAFSRSAAPVDQPEGLRWVRLEINDTSDWNDRGEALEGWVSLVPLWVLPGYFDFLARHGAKRLVALSSTSRFTKGTSSDRTEQELAQRIAASEDRVVEWAESVGIRWVILRPTLIYGFGRDRNVCEIARFIRRFRFFPILGEANGLRQPVHARDVARACVAALEAPISGRAYEISGAETLSYRRMVERIFEAEEVPARFVSVPRALFRLGIAAVRPLPRFRGWSIGMAERMNQDLSFGHEAAARDLGFSASAFQLSPEDLPP